LERQCSICVFAKPPEPGSAKTRLIPAVGTDGAAALAEAFLQDTWSTVGSLSWARPVIASTAPFQPRGLEAAPEIWLQGEGDLGERLERIFRRALLESEFAFALGADSPGLPARLLEQAREAMREADAVMGPCEDGGFYLLGLRKCPAGLLAGIRWSEAGTFEQVRTRLKSAGMRILVLDSWFDVDLPEDLEKLRKKIIAGEIQADATRAALDRLSFGETAAPTLKVSVILPVLNECEWLPRTIASLESQPWVHEIIAVDACSTDGTREWLVQQKRIIVIDSARGKGLQINAGAEKAASDILLFLHADSLLPPDAGEQIQNVLRSERVAGGCFCVRFEEMRPWALKLVSAGINLRTRWKRSATGDQGIFVRKETFAQVGGCPDWPLFEDVELVRRIKKRGEFGVVGSPLTISPRRYLEHGIFKTACLIYALRLAFWAGVSPFRLKTWFSDARSPASTPTPASSPRSGGVRRN
jgi:uncharacterized protein